MKPQAPIRWHGKTLKCRKIGGWREVSANWAEVDYPLGWPCQLKATKTGANFWLEISNQKSSLISLCFCKTISTGRGKVCCLRLDPDEKWMLSAYWTSLNFIFRSFVWICFGHSAGPHFLSMDLRQRGKEEFKIGGRLSFLKTEIPFPIFYRHFAFRPSPMMLKRHLVVSLLKAAVIF